MRTLFSTVLFAAVAMGMTSPRAFADTVFVSISPGTLTGNPGDTLQFFGTLTNTTSSTVFINGDTFTFPPGTVDDSPFLTAPLSLGPNEVSGSFEMFDVIIPIDLPPATYDGTFNVEGGADGNADDLLGTSAFHVEVESSAVPEPASLGLLASGIAMMLAFAKKRR